MLDNQQIRTNTTQKIRAYTQQRPTENHFKTLKLVLIPYQTNNTTFRKKRFYDN